MWRGRVDDSGNIGGWKLVVALPRAPLDEGTEGGGGKSNRLVSVSPPSQRWPRFFLIRGRKRFSTSTPPSIAPRHSVYSYGSARGKDFLSLVAGGLVTRSLACALRVSVTFQSVSITAHTDDAPIQRYVRSSAECSLKRTPLESSDGVIRCLVCPRCLRHSN